MDDIEEITIVSMNHLRREILDLEIDDDDWIRVSSFEFYSLMMESYEFSHEGLQQWTEWLEDNNIQISYPSTNDCMVFRRGA